MTCIYHSRDLDGWMSAAIVMMKYQGLNMIPWDYGQPIPKISINEPVIMVDISLPIEAMRNLMVNNDLIWIDHHISAIRDMDNAKLNPFGLREDCYAACELTWRYLYPDVVMIPSIIILLGKYDSFRHKGCPDEKEVLLFQYAARAILTNPVDCFTTLYNWTDDQTKEWLSNGETIYKYLCVEAKQIYERKFEIILGDYLFACVNQIRFNPVNFGINYHDDGYDGFVCFHYEDGKFIYSLYNDNGRVDCSLIAKSHGGGGHKGAAGFISAYLIKNL